MHERRIGEVAEAVTEIHGVLPYRLTYDTFSTLPLAAERMIASLTDAP